MARRSEQTATEPQAEKVDKKETEKVGVTLIGYDLFRFRILCATLNLRPSQLLQQLVVERLRGFKLPAGASYTPRKRRAALELFEHQAEDREAG